MLSDRQAALLEALAQVDSAADAGEALTCGLERLLTFMASHAGFAVWFQAEEFDGIVTAGQVTPSAPADVREACLRWCATATGPSFISEGAADDHSLLTVCYWLAAERLLAVPLGRPSDLKGCLVMAVPDDLVISPDFLAALECAGETLGMAVECVSLRSRVRRQTRLTQTLFDVSQAVTTAKDLDALLQLVVTAAVNTIEKAENCVLHLLDEPSGELRPRALSFLGMPPQEEGRSHMRLGQGAAGQALLNREVVNVSDVATDTRFVQVAEGRRFASMLVAPLLLGDRRIGTLSVDSSYVNAFGYDDERLLMMLASHVAAAIENRRLLHDLQTSLDELTEMQGRLIEVEKLSAMGRMISGVTHELNNPLAAVLGYAQLLQTNESLDDEARHDVQRVYAQADRAAKIVRNLQLFARQAPTARQQVDLNDVLTNALELQATQLRLQNITVDTRLHPQPLLVMGDYNQLQQVFFHLISNAREAMSQVHGQGKLSIATDLAGDTVRAFVVDDGPGIPPESKPHLFEPFYTTKEVGLGTGLGLSVCYGIVMAHGGRIFTLNEESEGATFVVELPAVLEATTQGPAI